MFLQLAIYVIVNETTLTMSLSTTTTLPTPIMFYIVQGIAN